MTWSRALFFDFALGTQGCFKLDLSSAPKTVDSLCPAVPRAFFRRLGHRCQQGFSCTPTMRSTGSPPALRALKTAVDHCVKSRYH